MALHKSRFSTHVRIDPHQKRYLEQHKDTKTVAGFLDKIINHYKQYEKDTADTTTSTDHEAPA